MVSRDNCQNFTGHYQIAQSMLFDYIASGFVSNQDVASELLHDVVRRLVAHFLANLADVLG